MFFVPSIKTKQNKMPTFKGLPVKLFSELRDSVKMSHLSFAKTQTRNSNNCPLYPKTLDQMKLSTNRKCTG